MALEREAHTNSPWEQFALTRHEFGDKMKRKETNKSRKKRLKAMNKTPRRKRKKKEELVCEYFKSHHTEDNGIYYNDAEASADKLAKKTAQTFRCGFQNVQMLPSSSRHYKNRQLINHIREGEYDV
jgi:hypothetical protein